MVSIDSVALVARASRKMLTKRVHFVDDFSWHEYFSKKRRTLMVVNHGPLYGPVLFFGGIVPRLADMGLGRMTYAGIAHPIVFTFPGVARQFGVSRRGRERYNVEDYVRLFQEEGLDALVVAPEGEYCIYGNGLDIQPFRSPRSLEIALRCDCRIMLAMGKGFETWQRNISIKAPWRKKVIRAGSMLLPNVDRLDEEYLEKADRYSVQLMPLRVRDFYICSRLYEPKLRAEDLADDIETRRQQLGVEAERMRSQMQVMVDRLKKQAP